jgi:hypothetical protein
MQQIMPIYDDVGLLSRNAITQWSKACLSSMRESS